jgi:hypothetical protein
VPSDMRQLTMLQETMCGCLIVTPCRHSEL